MSIPTQANSIYNFDAFFNEKETDYFLPNTPCAHCGEGTAFWSDDLDPLFMLKCNKCLSHTKPCFDRISAHNQWEMGKLFKIGTYKKGY